jgi:hypothetical protein
MVALAARALWVTLVHEPSRAVYSDMGGYFQRSGQVLESGRWDPYLFFQGAGYPLVLGVIRRLWAHDPDLGLVTAWVQIATSLAALAVTVKLARRLAGRWGAGMALALGAIHVPWIYFNSVYMAEGMYTGLLAAVGLALVAVARDLDARWRWTVLAGVLAGLAAWFKSAHLLVGPIAAVLWLFPLRRRWQGSARIFVGWMVGVALALWIPHGALSYAKSGRFMASPPAGGLNFVEGKCPSKENKDSVGYAYWSPLFVQKGIRNTKVWPRSFLDQGYFYAEGFKCVLERPVVLLESFEAIPELFVWNDLWPGNACGERSRWLNDAWARVFAWPLLSGVAIAFLVALGRSRRLRAVDEKSAVLWLAVAAPVLSLFAVVWIMKSEVRYRVPFDVFLFPMALWGWKELLAWCWRRAFRTAAPSVASGDAAAAAPSTAPAAAPGDGPAALEPLGAAAPESSGDAPPALS